MPRTRTGRTTNGPARRRINGGGGVSSIRLAPRPRPVSVAPYARDPRWATPARPRNDVVVVDRADRYPATTSRDEDPLLLTA